MDNAQKHTTFIKCIFIFHHITTKHSYAISKNKKIKLNATIAAAACVDKSNKEMDHDHSKDTSRSSNRNERERFFEFVEYKKDILKYLKQTEVIISTILSHVEQVLIL